jgi:methylglutaconyl-CoA hydratase
MPAGKRDIRRSYMIEAGKVTLTVEDRIGTIEFSHPKSNSLPGSLLAELAETV